MNTSPFYSPRIEMFVTILLHLYILYQCRINAAIAHSRHMQSLRQLCFSGTQYTLLCFAVLDLPPCVCRFVYLGSQVNNLVTINLNNFFCYFMAEASFRSLCNRFYIPAAGSISLMIPMKKCRFVILLIRFFSVCLSIL